MSLEIEEKTKIYKNILNVLEGIESNSNRRVLKKIKNENPNILIWEHKIIFPNNERQQMFFILPKQTKITDLNDEITSHKYYIIDCFGQNKEFENTIDYNE